MGRPSRTTHDSSRHRHENTALVLPENQTEKRKNKLAELLSGAPAIEDGLTLPDSPARYVALEQSFLGDTIWAYFADVMTGIMEQLENSDTSFVDRIRVHDLDTDLVYAPKWIIESICEVPR